MICNVGKKDRIARIVFGSLILLAGLIGKSWFGLIGLIPLTTAAIRFCPLYPVFKINTAKDESESKA